MSRAVDRVNRAFSAKTMSRAIREEISESMSGAEDAVVNSKSLPAIRGSVQKIIDAPAFDVIMGVIILFNLVFIVLEADETAQCYPEWAHDLLACPFQIGPNHWLTYTNYVLLAIYSAEALVKMFVYGLSYFCNKWNMLDVFVVVTALFSAFGSTQSFAFLRIIRIVRVCRAFRVVLTIKELYLLLVGLVSSFKAIIFGSALLLAMLVCWSIVVVEFVHPVNAVHKYEDCPTCSQGFESVARTTLTLFQQVIAGDSWGMISVPVISDRPWLAIILVSIYLSISLATMNLILAVIVESANEARERDTEQKAKDRRKAQKAKKLDLLTLCETMDKDGDGVITLDEMVTAWKENGEFRRLITSLDMSKKDLENIFVVMDSRGEGEVKYRDFVHKLYDLRSTDMRLMLALIGLSQLDQKVLQVQRQSELNYAEVRQQGAMIEAIAQKLDVPSAIPSPIMKGWERPLTWPSDDSDFMAVAETRQWSWNNETSGDRVNRSIAKNRARKNSVREAKVARDFRDVMERTGSELPSEIASEMEAFLAKGGAAVRRAEERLSAMREQLRGFYAAPSIERNVAVFDDSATGGTSPASMPLHGSPHRGGGSAAMLGDGGGLRSRLVTPDLSASGAGPDSSSARRRLQQVIECAGQMAEEQAAVVLQSGRLIGKLAGYACASQQAAPSSPAAPSPQLQLPPRRLPVMVEPPRAVSPASSC